MSQTDRTKSKKVELIIQQLNSLPTLPAVAARLLQLTVKHDTQAAEVVQLIESDQSLASKIIMMATRANRGMSKKAASLSKAVVFLGFDAVRNAVLSIKVFETLGKPQKGDLKIFDRTAFWKHSLAVACAARMLARHVDKKVDSEEAFLCGLLHDMGKVALDACLPKSFARVVQFTEASLGNIAEVEQKLLGLDHTVVGKRLAEQWHLPPSILETIWLHHQSPSSLPEAIRYSSIVKIVHLADVLAREQRIGYSGNHQFTETASNIARVLGCTSDVLDKVIRQLRSEISDRSVILGLDELEPDDLYQEALVEANSELGQLNQKLEMQNRHLSVRSRYFDLFNQLGSSLDTHQSLVDVCSMVATLWGQHIGSDQCAVYARDGEEQIIEGSLVVEQDAKPSVFLVDCSDDPDLNLENGPSWELPSGFHVGFADESHNWFFEQVAPMFEPGMTAAMPLHVGPEVVGGVFWKVQDKQTDYQDQLSEMEAFSALATMAVRQAQKHESQTRLCEQLARSNQKLHDAQQELLQNRSLAVVGEMACGAAHEINNPLAVVVGRSQLLFSREEDEEKRKMLEAINRQGQQISAIISELMEFAQPSIPHPKACSISDLLDQAIGAQLEKAEQNHVDLTRHLDDDLPTVFVDPGQIGPALSELISNAIDAYQGNGGTVQIKAHYDELEDDVILEVIDTGCGMDRATLDKAFSPFFSARRSGRSRGLGLSRSNRHIIGNGGRLNLISDVGKGTTARVILPIGQTSPALQEHETIAT